VAFLLPASIVGERYLLVFSAALLLGNGDDIFQVRYGDGMQDDCVHHAEDGGVDADADGQRKDRGQGKPRGTEQLAEGEANVAVDLFEHG
jgi:hypothetical protein